MNLKEFFIKPKMMEELLNFHMTEKASKQNQIDIKPEESGSEGKNKLPTISNEGFQRRDFLGSIAKAGLFGAVLQSPLSSFAGDLSLIPVKPEESHSFLTQAYLQSPTSNRINIRWITNKRSYSWVEYGETERLGKKAHEITDGLVDAYNRINNIALQDLKPGTKYYYKICSKEIVEFEPYKLTYGETVNSEIMSFTTFDNKAKEVSWLVLNDIHDRPGSYGDLFALNKNQEYDYVFLNGDMFDYQTSEQQLIDHLIEPCTTHFAKNKPFLFVRGNHETRGKFARDIKNYFSNFGHGQYFTFLHGPVYTIALDTGEDKPDDAPVYAGIVDFDAYRKQQAYWLEKELQSEAARKSPFRVVMMHIPPYYSGDWHGTLHCRELFDPIFNKYKVDLVLSGHTHRHGIHPPVEGQHKYPIIIGGGPQAGKRTLIRVNANPSELKVQMLGDTGVELGNYLVKRRK